MFFPEAIVALVDAWQSLLRIEEFLLVEDVMSREHECTGTTSGYQRAPDGQPSPNIPKLGEDEVEDAFKMEGATFSWTKNASATTFALQPVKIRVKRGELLAITGATSSGKSTLAAGIAGHMFQMGGVVQRQCVPVYVPAITWIFSASLRGNIVFGLQFQREEYCLAVTMCGIQPDLREFPHGDLTWLGESGINISGGQKARVGLARAFYVCLVAWRSNETIVMDDPLAALDASTGQAVFENAILDRMSHTTRVLITHQAQYLRRCNRAVWIEEGGIRAVGSFVELMEGNTDFRAFIGKEIQMNEERNTEAE